MLNYFKLQLFCSFKMVKDKTLYSTMLAPKIYESNVEDAVANACKALNASYVIAVPTDTVYGLACNANNCTAIRRLYSIKDREPLKPVAICVADLENLKLYGKADHLEHALLNELLPGPITVVLEKTKNLSSPYLNPGTNKIGIRIPNLKFIQDLCATIRYPLALTSANKSTEPSSLSVNEFSHIWFDLAAIFDGGTLSQDENFRAASSVIDLSFPGKYKIIRKGIAVEKIINTLKKYNIQPLND